MKRFKHLVMALSAAFTVSCGANHSSAPTPLAADGEIEPAPNKARAPISPTRSVAADSSRTTPSAKESLARLRALEVIDVGALIVDVPMEATQCYGPCPGYEDVVADARAKAATRLAALVELAERTAPTPSTNAKADANNSARDHVARNIAALNALRIVHVESLALAEPANNPNCYNLPCQADRDRADRITNRRAAHLVALAKASEGL